MEPFEDVDILFELDFFWRTLKKKQFNKKINIASRKLRNESYLIRRVIYMVLIGRY